MSYTIRGDAGFYMGALKDPNPGPIPVTAMGIMQEAASREFVLSERLLRDSSQPYLWNEEETLP